MKLTFITHKTRHGVIEPKCKPGEWFSEKVLAPLNLSFDDVHVIQPCQRLPEDTTHIALLGYEAAKLLLDTRKDLTFNKARGNLFKWQNRWATVSFNHQDAFDMSMSGVEDEEDQHNPDDVSGKDDCYIRPINWRWWLCADVAKLFNTPLDYKFETPSIVIEPPIEEAIAELNNKDNEILFLDIETRRIDYSLDCIGVACNDRPVYVTPIYRWDHHLYYTKDKILSYLVALTRAMARCRTVVHNANFEFLVFPLFYHIPFGHDIYDTMVAHHRIWPFQEKSLAAAISYWTRLPYHKDLYQVPGNERAFSRLLTYNGKDVYGTRAIYYAMESFVKENPSYERSIKDGQRTLIPYLTASLTGWDVDTERLDSNKNNLTRQIAQLKRIFSILLPQWPDFNPKSPDQCARLLHDTLGLKVGRIKAKTKKPEMDEKNLQKLKVRNGTSFEIGQLIGAIIKYRFVTKALETITFEEYPGV